MKFELGYYRCIEPIFDDRTHEEAISEGNLICIHSFDQGHYRFSMFQDDRTRQFSLSEEEISSNLRLVPEEEARRERAEEIIRLNAEVAELHGEASKSRALLAGAENLLTGGSQVPESDSTDLVASDNNTVEEAREQIAQARYSISDSASKIKGLHSQITLLSEEQMLLAKGRLSELEGFMKGVEEVIVMANLYLGRDEAITPITEGSLAPDEDPICFRQRLLYMDEECLVAIDEGGIDFGKLEDFDQWVSQPENLKMILPESKGVVAFQVRRKELLYSTNAIENMAANEGNFRTYFLIRNGERLWRITNELTVESNLFPTEKEFDDMFLVEDAFSREVKRVRPGQREYYEVMKKVGAKQREYMRVLLLLQGLLDRTQIFRSSAGDLPRVNLMDPASFGTECVFVRDNEMVLDNGMPPFEDWLLSLNAEITEGVRICGAFDNYDTRSYFRDEQRVYPRTSYLPDSLELYSVSKHKHQWRILYENTFSFRDSSRRSSFRIEASDLFFVNFDAATLEDLEYYLGDRRYREHYLKMIPLLKCCIKLKKEESAYEAPFLELLQRTLSEETGEEVDLNDIASLVDWWKFKNRTHRAIGADDGKAMRMILSEYHLFKRREQDFKRIEDNKESYAHLWSRDNVLLAAHKTGRDIVTIEKASTLSYLVHEVVWTYKKDGSVVEKSRKDWTVADNRSSRWKILFESEEWEDWPKHLNRKKFITDPEIQAGLQKIRSESENEPFLVFFYGNRLRSFAIDSEQTKYLRGAYVDNAALDSKTWQWTRNGDGEIDWVAERGHPSVYKCDHFGRPDDPSLVWVWDQPDYKDCIIHFNPEVAEEYVAKVNACNEVYLIESAQQDVAFCFRNQLVHNLEQQWKDEQMAIFAKDGGHPDFLEDHLKTLKKPVFPHQADLPDSILDYVISVWECPSDKVSARQIMPDLIDEELVVLKLEEHTYTWPTDLELNWIDRSY